MPFQKTQPKLLYVKWRPSDASKYICQIDNRPTQLPNATGIEGGIHDCQVLKYQPAVTSRLMFQDLMIIYGIKWWNITLDVTDGWRHIN